MGSKRMNGDQLKMSKVQKDWYLIFTAKTQKHCNTYLSSILLISLFTP